MYLFFMLMNEKNYKDIQEESEINQRIQNVVLNSAQKIQLI
jgi:hypothetical protein